MQPPILPPRAEELLSPLLASLPAASISPQPPTALLPLLSPILRQRVQLLSSTSTSSDEPWLPLLCYDSSQSSKLQSLVRNERFEPHPVSGEVEIDWESELSTSYKRIDTETLQSLITLHDLQLCVKLIWCTNDELGGGDGWRIGEVSVSSLSDDEWGFKSIGQAEDAFHNQPSTYNNLSSYNRTNGTNSLLTPEAEEEDDDDDYWAQYDNTPARTPAPKQSPAPPPLSAVQRAQVSVEDEERYYAQYASVQPAMDNHDPDEAQQNGEVETSLGRDEITQELQRSQREFSHPTIDQEHELHSSSAAWSDDPAGELYTNGHMDGVDIDHMEGLAHPRPGSSTGSSGSDTVEKLERRAAARESREQSEVGIKQHIGTSIKSLYRLAKVAGIDRAEFERIVRTEMECLALMDEDED
ncbi:hypothetical protein N431DRAFT_438638 [Stipitochalara longipes BDJ]|nr:hypothetical protein N431DRAFT_438638 [Stipitochalara longipes BDJ]